MPEDGGAQNFRCAAIGEIPFSPKVELCWERFYVQDNSVDTIVAVNFHIPVVQDARPRAQPTPKVVEKLLAVLPRDPHVQRAKLGGDAATAHPLSSPSEELGRVTLP